MYITPKQASNSPVTQKRFAVHFFLPSCCVSNKLIPIKTHLCLSSVLTVRSTDSCCIKDSKTGCDKGQGD